LAIRQVAVDHNEVHVGTNGVGNKPLQALGGIAEVVVLLQVHVTGMRRRQKSHTTLLFPHCTLHVSKCLREVRVRFFGANVSHCSQVAPQCSSTEIAILREYGGGVEFARPIVESGVSAFLASEQAL
jgi:hypothetical protein